MEDYVVRVIFLGVMLWTTLFMLTRKVFSGRSFDFCNRIVSTAHACSAVVLTTLSVQDWSCPVHPLASHSSPQQMQTLAVSVAYLMYDLVCCVFDKKVKVDNAVHHLVSIIGLMAGLAYQRCGSEMVAALWITEVSSPFLHLRELLKEIGYRDTDLNLAADIGFAVIFTFARMMGGPYLTYVTLSADNPFMIKSILFVGLISTEDLGEVSRSLGQNPTEDELKDIIGPFDVEASDDIHFPQFLNLMAREMKDAFNVGDKNQDDFISAPELREILTSLGEKVTDEGGDGYDKRSKFGW